MISWFKKHKAIKFNLKNSFMPNYKKGKMMCPKCGNISESIGFSCFTGSFYKSCCVETDTVEKGMPKSRFKTPSYIGPTNAR